MRCGASTPEDCAIEHWSPQLGGRKEPTGWRAPCPVCHIGRILKYKALARTIRWSNYCSCERETVRKALGELLPQCLSQRRDKTAQDAAIEAVILADMPPITMRLRVLELLGHPTGEALDLLEVRQSNRGRVIAGRTGAASKWKQTPRKAPHPNG